MTAKIIPFPRRKRRIPVINLHTVEWRLTKKCLDEARWTCQNCNRKRQPGLWMVAHHIESRAVAPHLARNSDNLVCLCNLCHPLIHGIKPDTSRQFELPLVA